MSALVLMPRPRRLDYALYGDGTREALAESHVAGSPSDAAAVTEMLGGILAVCVKRTAAPPGLVVIRAAYGGDAFTQTTRVNAAMLSRFAALAAEAPIHVPPVHLLAEAALRVFSDAVVAMAFETAFFVDLPDRERRYGIADDRVRRFGYHGLYHQAASREREGLRDGTQTRTLSLCLEPQPELAAVIGHRPVMVTSGATPLEGLPGETTCGELDPTIVLTLARQMRWGPEQINDVLTRQSGLRGLLGRPMHLGKLLDSATRPAKGGALPPAADGSVDAACNILAYRILLAAGAGVSAMGGLDRIVLTGRYAAQGRDLGEWLAQRLRPAGVHRNTKHPAVVLCQTPLSRILADHAFVSLQADQADISGTKPTRVKTTAPAARINS